MVGPTRLGVRVLGPFALDGVDLSALRSRKARQVLAVLALADGAPVSSDALVDAIWNDDLPTDPARDLAVLVSRARALVGSDRLIRRTGGYALASDWSDRAECSALVRSAVRRRDSGDLAGARSAAEAALGLVRGPLLADEPDASWAAAPREAAAALVAEARHVLAEASLAAGQVGEAATQARAALDHDPYDEAAARILMRALVAAGRPANALTTYAKLARRLADELGVDPSPPTRRLHEWILRGQPVPDTPLRPAVVGPEGQYDNGHGDRQRARFVGRRVELARLDTALADSRHSAQVVVVVGEPGAGKTALLDHWTAAARRNGVTVLSSRAEPGGLALQPALDAVAGRLPETESIRDVGSQLDGRRLPGPTASAEAFQRQLFAEVERALANSAGSGGLALTIDDLQYADATTHAWLGHLLRRADSHRLLILAAASDPAISLPGDAIRLALPPLGLDEIAVLVGSDRAAALFERTGGNALLVTELAHATEDLPATVRASVTARLAEAGEAALTLRAAAVLGPRIDLDLLTSILALGPLTVLEHLDDGVRRAFLVERDGALEFRHELVRVAVAADTGVVRRAWIHRQAALLLAERPGGAPLERLRHARLCADDSVLLTTLTAAADTARARVDLSGAEKLLDEALSLADSAELRLRRSRVRMARGDLIGADADAEAALTGDTTGEALELRAWAARNRYDMEAAIRLGSAGAARASDPTTKASCLVAVAFAHRGRGELAATERLLHEAADLDPPPDLGLSAWTGVLQVHQGRPAEALDRLEPLLGTESERGLQAFWVEHILQMTAHAYGLVGRTSDALSVLDRLAIEMERRGSEVRYAGATETYRSWILRNLGAGGAIELASSGLERAHTPEIRAQCHLDLADGLLRAGELDAAAGHLAQADATARAQWFHNQWRFDQRLGILRARLALASGDWQDAAEQAATARDSAATRGDRRYRAVGTVVLDTALARSGEPFDGTELRGQLALLPDVAALEAWWLAADLAAATGRADYRALSADWVERLLVGAGEHVDSLRAAARRYVG